MTSPAARRLLGRLAQTVLIVVFVTTIVFVLIHLAPGDPFSMAIDNPNVTEAIRAQWRHALQERSHVRGESPRQLIH